MAGRQQPRSAEQLLAQGAGQVVALVGAALLQDRHHQVDEVLEALGGHDTAQIEAVDIGFLDPGDQIVGDLLGGADDVWIAAAEPHPPMMRRTVHGSALLVVRVSTAELIASFFT